MATRYVDWSDAVAEYPSLAKDKSSDTFERYIVSAEGECDARLAPRYAVPFSPGSSSVPQIVRSLAVDVAYYRCAWRQDGMDVLKAYIDERFASLLAGSMSLVTSAGVLSTVQVQAWTDRTDRSSFGPDGFENHSVSNDWQQTAEDERSGD